MKKKALSDEAYDAITAVTLIGIIVFGVVFWLYGLPS